MCPPCCWTTHSHNVLQKSSCFQLLLLRHWHFTRYSVATLLKCGGILLVIYSVIRHFLLILTVKKVWEVVSIWRSYKAYKNVPIFWATLYMRIARTDSNRTWSQHTAGPEGLCRRFAFELHLWLTNEWINESSGTRSPGWNQTWLMSTVVGALPNCLYEDGLPKVKRLMSLRRWVTRV